MEHDDSLSDAVSLADSVITRRSFKSSVVESQKSPAGSQNGKKRIVVGSASLPSPAPPSERCLSTASVTTLKNKKAFKESMSVFSVLQLIAGMIFAAIPLGIKMSHEEYGCVCLIVVVVVLIVLVMDNQEHKKMEMVKNELRSRAFANGALDVGTLYAANSIDQGGSGVHYGNYMMHFFSILTQVSVLFFTCSIGLTLFWIYCVVYSFHCFEIKRKTTDSAAATGRVTDMTRYCMVIVFNALWLIIYHVLTSVVILVPDVVRFGSEFPTIIVILKLFTFLIGLYIEFNVKYETVEAVIFFKGSSAYYRPVIKFVRSISCMTIPDCMWLVMLLIMVNDLAIPYLYYKTQVDWSRIGFMGLILISLTFDISMLTKLDESEDEPELAQGGNKKKLGAAVAGSQNVSDGKVGSKENKKAKAGKIEEHCKNGVWTFGYGCAYLWGMKDDVEFIGEIFNNKVWDSATYIFLMFLTGVSAFLSGILGWFYWLFTTAMYLTWFTGGWHVFSIGMIGIASIFTFGVMIYLVVVCIGRYMRHILNLVTFVSPFILNMFFNSNLTPSAGTFISSYVTNSMNMWRKSHEFMEIGKANIACVNALSNTSLTLFCGVRRKLLVNKTTCKQFVEASGMNEEALQVCSNVSKLRHTLSICFGCEYLTEEFMKRSVEMENTSSLFDISLQSMKQVTDQVLCKSAIEGTPMFESCNGKNHKPENMSIESAVDVVFQSIMDPSQSKVTKIWDAATIYNIKDAMKIKVEEMEIFYTNKKRVMTDKINRMRAIRNATRTALMSIWANFTRVQKVHKILYSNNTSEIENLTMKDKKHASSIYLIVKNMTKSLNEIVTRKASQLLDNLKAIVTQPQSYKDDDALFPSTIVDNVATEIWMDMAKQLDSIVRNTTDDLANATAGIFTMEAENVTLNSALYHQNKETDDVLTLENAEWDGSETNRPESESEPFEVVTDTNSTSVFLADFSAALASDTEEMVKNSGNITEATRKIVDEIRNVSKEYLNENISSDHETILNSSNANTTLPELPTTSWGNMWAAATNFMKNSSWASDPVETLIKLLADPSQLDCKSQLLWCEIRGCPDDFFKNLTHHCASEL